MQTSQPTGWVFCRFGDIAQIRNGYAFRSSAFKKTKTHNSDVPLIRQSQLIGSAVDIGEAVYLPVEYLVRCAEYVIRKGDILIGMSGAIGKVCRYQNDFPALQNQRTGKIEVFDESQIDARFFGLYLSSIESELVRQAKGMGVQNISAKDIEALPLGLPPLNEQRRIVTKLEELFSELDKGIENLKTARARLKVYRQAVLKHAFEGKLTARWREENKDKLETPEQLLARIQQEREARYQQQLEEWKAAVKAWEGGGKKGKKPVKPRKPELVNADSAPLIQLPNEWQWIFVGDLNAGVFDGPFGSNLKTSDYFDEGIRVIRLENIGYLEFIESKHSYVTEKKYESIKKHTVQSDDIIFSSFVTDGIRVVVLPETIERAVNKADCFCVQLHGETVRNDYLASYLSTQSAYKQIEVEIHGLGWPRINTTQLKNFSIPLCSLNEQDEIMSRITAKLSNAAYIDEAIDQELRSVKC